MRGGGGWYSTTFASRSQYFSDLLAILDYLRPIAYELSSPACVCFTTLRRIYFSFKRRKNYSRSLELGKRFQIFISQHFSRKIKKKPSHPIFFSRKFQFYRKKKIQISNFSKIQSSQKKKKNCHLRRSFFFFSLWFELKPMGKLILL